MPRFVLLAYDAPGDFADVSPDEMQRIVERYMAWSERLRSRGQLLHSDKLTDSGARRVTRSGAQLLVRDGPFAESKEVLGGFWMIEAADYDEALRIAGECPHVEFGQLEVREVEELER